MDRKIRITEGVKNEEKLLENELSQKIEVTGGYSSAEEFRGVIRRMLNTSTVKSQRGYSIIRVYYTVLMAQVRGCSIVCTMTGLKAEEVNLLVGFTLRIMCFDGPVSHVFLGTGGRSVYHLPPSTIW